MVLRTSFTDESIILPFAAGLELFPQREGSVYRSRGADSGQTVFVTFDRDGQLLEYEQADLGHTFRVIFDAGLPTRDGGRVGYSMSLDGFEGLIEGVATVTRNGDAASVEWNHTKPSWALGYRFVSSLRAIGPSGYDLTVTSLGR